MNPQKTITAMLAAGAATFAFADAAIPPSVSDVTMTQGNDRRVTITYALAHGPAVVTLDIQTNATPNAAASDPGWTSIGGEAVWNAMGDVWKKVSGDAVHTITWRPDQSWPDHRIVDNRARAVVTAWALDNTPDYMVVDLDVDSEVRFYPSAEFLPRAGFAQQGSAVTNNPENKTSKLLMRKIEAEGIEWTMGSADGEKGRNATKEAPHLVTLTNNYYIGVFEVTRGQFRRVATNSNAVASSWTDASLVYAMNSVCYNELRTTHGHSGNVSGGVTVTAGTGGTWPGAPSSDSFLGLLRLKSGLPFDLPSEAQWEFACRAGNYSGLWNDGSAITGENADVNLKRLARFLSNSGNAVGPVGAFNPSSNGLYDMHGNVAEICLDWYEDNIATATDTAGETYGGRVNVDAENPAYPLSHSAAGSLRARRGGNWSSVAGACRSASRDSRAPQTRAAYDGFRVICPVGIE